jgi:hypothetical protein
MLLAELKTRRQVILQEQEKYRYILYEATKQETNELFSEIEKVLRDHSYKSKTFDFLSMIDFFGEIEDVNHYHVKDIIPTDKVHIIRGDRPGKSEIVTENKCYQNHKPRHPYNNIVVHEDKISSFKCACELAKTVSFIVLKEPQVTIFGTSGAILSKELIQLENIFKDGTNNSGDTTAHT